MQTNIPEIDNSKNPNLNKVFTDMFGNNWYCNVNPLNISAMRGLSAEKAKRFMMMKLDEHTMRALIDKACAVAGTGDLVQGFAIMYEIKHRLDFVCEENSVLDLVFMYYFLEDEDPDVALPHFNLKKRGILMKDKGARAFFLRIGVSIMTKFSGIPEESLLGSLEKLQMEAERIYRFIQPENPSDLMNSSTDSNITPVKEDKQT